MLIIWNKYLLKKLIILIILFTFSLIVIQYKLASNDYTPKFSFKKASLTYRKKSFFLKDERFQILSGSIHYFRVPPDQWKNKLKYLKSSGLNTVETYCPWNLHEERKGIYNFEGNLNIRSFVQMAFEIGLFVILRPGPYICGELEFGGLPSWLLSDPNMKIRSMYIGFMVPVEDYLRQLLREINDLQHSNGGPIIAFQIENEYGTFGNSPSYMQTMKEIYIRSGVVESMFISNDFEGIANQKNIENVFYAINSNEINQIDKMVQVISASDSESPIFISELFTGWYQTWQKPKSNIITDEEFELLITTILKKGYSFNLYMFHGGTNFGFINGGNNISKTPSYVSTSYDYNAPLSEDGRPNRKFFILRKAILSHMASDKGFRILDVPEKENPVRYGEVDMTHILEFDSILDAVDNMVVSYDLKTMEELPINGKSGQSFGFIVYRTEISHFSDVLLMGSVRDRAIVLYQYEPLTNYWKTSLINSYNRNWSNVLSNTTKSKASKSVNYLDFIIENMGRINYATFQTETFNEQRKGMKGKVFVDKKKIDNWKIYPLEFKKPFIHKVSASSNWKIYHHKTLEQRPRMYKSIFVINEKPANTHILMSSWTKGVVFINGYNLGRYWNTGPSQSLFLPKSFLRYGENEIIIFELHIAGKSVILQSNPVFLDPESAVFN